MTNAQLMLTYARNFFKGSLKTSNKTFSRYYGSALPPRRLRRINASEKAAGLIPRLRHRQDNIDAVLLLHAMNPEDRAGSCKEYTCVALKFGLDTKIPNIWLVKHELHGFLVLTNESRLPDKLMLSEFEQFKNDEFWVCDAWFNIHCRMDMYAQMVTLQSNYWTLEGKEIYTTENIHIPANQWCQRLRIGEMEFLRMTDSAGMPTDECSDCLSS